MALSVNQIRYGWAALTGLVITGATIFIVGNTRQNFAPQDIVEIAVATDERCIGIQTADGVYPVDRPSYIRMLYTNTYGPTSVVAHAQAVTNTITWQIDAVMIQDLQGKIKGLIPKYRDSTTWDLLTVTGVFAELGVGNGVSDFTQAPAIGTNPATYGALSYHLYETNLVEMYRVLASLQWASNGYMKVVGGAIYLWDGVDWVVNGSTLTNAAFGSNASFYYATNRYWE